MSEGHRLARNGLLNLLTGGILLLLNIVFVPLLLRSFGSELYGVLAVTWMVLSHLGWLDLGFSAATTRYVAQALPLGRLDEASSWTWTALFAQSLIGAAAAMVLWLLAPPVVPLLGIDQESQALVIFTLRLFAFAIPLDLVARSLSGVLEAAQRFAWINVLSLVGGLWTFGTYAIGIWRGGDFHLVVIGLFLLKVVHLVGMFWLAGRVLSSLHSLRWRLFNLERLRAMARFGGWVSISSAVGPLLLYFDRWVVSLQRGVAALPLYTIPCNALRSLSIFPSSLAASMFPAFSALEAKADWKRVEEWFIDAHRWLLLVLLPLLFVLFIWAPELLRVWIGSEFAIRASSAFRILVLGFGIGLLAPISGALLQGAGRPDLLAKLYLVELPVNIGLVWFLVREFGIVGAAAAYAIRALVETCSLWVVVHRAFPLARTDAAMRLFSRMVSMVLFLGLSAYLLRDARLQSFSSVAATVCVLGAYAGVVQIFFLEKRDRALMRELWKTVRLRRAQRQPSGSSMHLEPKI